MPPSVRSVAFALTSAATQVQRHHALPVRRRGARHVDVRVVGVEHGHVLALQRRDRIRMLRGDFVDAGHDLVLALGVVDDD